MARRELGEFEAKVVELVGARISRNEAREVALIVGWLGDFLLARGKDLLSASSLDIRDFCEERSSTRVDASMVRLISSLKAVFSILRDTCFRSDDPALELQRPRLEAVTPSYEADDAALDRVANMSESRAGDTPKKEFVKKRMSAILRLAREAGALYSEMSALDLVGPCESLVLARGGRRERKARLSIEGRRVVEEYRQIRVSVVAPSDAALFTLARAPWTRLDGKTIATMVQKAIREAGLSSSELKAAMIHRSASGAIIDQGLGWDVAATSAAYIKIPNVRRQKTDLETMKRLIDAFDRFLLPD